MPFVIKNYRVKKGEKIQISLLKELKFNLAKAQRLLAKKRIFSEEGKVLKNGDITESEHINIVEFEGITKGLKPLISFNDFALFDKPTNLMVHPSNRHTPYCLLDEVKYHFGSSGNIVHRIDAETSGLILISKNKKSEKELKVKFETKDYKKSYLAIVEGQIKKEIIIDKPISAHNGNIKIKMTTGNEGKASQTIIKPIRYNNEKKQTLVEAIPITGRQHQIRVHLDSIGHKIVGDPIYGVDESIADAYLCKTLSDTERINLTGSHRLWLHANYLEFEYNSIIYKFKSLDNEISMVI